jgi:hypothetical protein
MAARKWTNFMAGKWADHTGKTGCFTTIGKWTVSVWPTGTDGWHVWSTLQDLSSRGREDTRSGPDGSAPSLEAAKEAGVEAVKWIIANPGEYFIHGYKGYNPALTGLPETPKRRRSSRR